MSIKISIRARLTCPAHTRYDPAKQREGGIVGGCLRCHELYSLQLRVEDLATEIVNFTGPREIYRETHTTAALAKRPPHG